MITVRKVTLDEFPDLFHKMKRFEEASKHVFVDINQCIKTYTNFVKTGIGAVFGLFDDNNIIGGLGCIKAHDIHYGSLMAIETFWLVLPEYRGKGLLLFNAFEQWADDQQCTDKAMIHLSDSFPQALEKFYKRKGYELAEYHFIKRGKRL